jgi:MFS family permease
VLVLLGSWNLASNVAAPFLTIYLIQQLGYGLTTVTGLWVLSQLSNVLTIYLWGRLSDRLSNKAVLSVALPAYFACLLSLVFIDSAAGPNVKLAGLALMHVVMGMAAGGIGLAAGNLGLKFAPQDQATSYLAMTGLVSAVVGGMAPILAGAIAQWVAQSELSMLVRWTSPSRHTEVSLLSFAHWEFLFALSAILGLYVMHALSRIDEGDQVSEHRVMQEFAIEALRTVNHLSSVGGVLGGLFPFQRLAERRRRPRA